MEKQSNNQEKEAPARFAASKSRRKREVQSSYVEKHHSTFPLLLIRAIVAQNVESEL